MELKICICNKLPGNADASPTTLGSGGSKGNVSECLHTDINWG